MVDLRYSFAEIELFSVLGNIYSILNMKILELKKV